MANGLEFHGNSISIKTNDDGILIVTENDEIFLNDVQSVALTEFLLILHSLHQRMHG